MEYDFKGQRHVVLSTFAAELLSAVDTIDKGLLLAQQMHEMLKGPLSAATARQMRFDGGFCVPLVLYVDATSVFAAVTATFIKTPAEKSLLCHVQFLRELLDRGVLKTMCWIDTRDMVADGLTKGAVDRTLLHCAMDGKFTLQREVKPWFRKVGASSLERDSPAELDDDKDWNAVFTRSLRGFRNIAFVAFAFPLCYQHAATACAEERRPAEGCTGSTAGTHHRPNGVDPHTPRWSSSASRYRRATKRRCNRKGFP